MTNAEASAGKRRLRHGVWVSLSSAGDGGKDSFTAGARIALADGGVELALAGGRVEDSFSGGVIAPSTSGQCQGGLSFHGTYQPE